MNGPFYSAGFYACQVQSHGWGTSRNGHPQLTIKMKPMASVRAWLDDAGAVQQARSPVEQNYDRTIYLVFPSESEQAQEFALMKLRQAGFKGTDLRDVDFVGQEIVAECKHVASTKNPGEMFEGWELPLPPRESQSVESDDSIARKLNTMLGRKLKDGASPERPAPVTPENPITDSDIPF